jgi:hypothetical protein
MVVLCANRGDIIVEITSHTAPMILQSFSKDLLSVPAPLFRENSQRLLKQFEYLIWWFNKKTSNGWDEIKRKSGLKIIEELQSTYEWIKIKEKELEGKTSHRTQEFYYHVGGLSKEDDEICRGFEFKRIPRPHGPVWNHYAFQEAKSR